MANDIETISYINPGDGLNHPIDAVTVSGLTLTSAEKELWNSKQDALSFDSIPTENSNNMVKSGPLYSVITENELVTATALNDLNDRVTSLEDFSETDPTVPGWAKASTKPTYTASEVGALPDTTAIPTESTVTGWGFTKNSGTVTGISMNGSLVGTSGIIDLGTVLTSHQDITSKADKSAAIGSLSLSIDSSNYQITLSGTKVDGTAFSVSNVIDLPLESVVVSGSYNNSTKKVVLTLQNGSTLDFSVADLVAGLQSEITSSNKLSADLIQDGNTNKVVTATEKSTWNSAVRSVTFNGSSVSVSDGSVSISESDPVFTSSVAYSITSSDISNWDSKANTSSPAFTGTPTAPTASANTSNSQIATTAFVQSVAGSVSKISAGYQASISVSGPYIPARAYSFNSVTDNSTGNTISVDDVDYTKAIEVHIDWEGEEADDPRYTPYGTLTLLFTYGIDDTAGSYTSAFGINYYTPIIVETNCGLQMFQLQIGESNWYLNVTDINLMTSSEKTKLAGIAAGAEVNVNADWNALSGDAQILNKPTIISSVTFNGSSVSVSDGSVSISESDPVFSASPAAGISAADISNWNSKTSNTGTISSIIFNGTTLPVSNGVVEISEEDPTLPYFDSNDMAYWNSKSNITAISMNGSGVNMVNTGQWTFTADLGTVISSVTFNGTSASVSNGVASISVSIPAEVTEATVSSWGFTKNTGTLTSHATHKLNIGSATATAAASNTITYVESLTGTTTATSGNLTITPTLKTITVPAEVTESTVAGWGFTKNTGTLTSESDPVFTSSVAYTITSANISTWNNKQNALSAGTFNVMLNGTTVGTYSINQDGNSSANIIVPTTLASLTGDSTHRLVTDADISNWNSKTSNTGTLTGVKFNGTNATVSNGVASISVTIPAEVTESTVAGWGFTKNVGTLTSESDPVFSASVAASITAADISNWNSKTSNTGTVTGSSLTANKIVLGNGGTAIKNSTYGISTTAPASGSDDTTLPTSKAVYSAITTALTSVLKYKGTIGTGGTVTSLPATHSVGDVYVVSVSGTYAGKACEVGDYILCKTAGTSANNAHWDVVNGENQVDNKSASLASAGSSATIATVDGTNITISTPASWTGVDKTGTLTGVSFNGTAASISNGIASISANVLPSVSASDNGKILQVSSGSWSLVTPVSVYSGSSAPDSNNGIDGDLYIQTS